MPTSSPTAPDWSRVTAVMVTHHSAAVVGACFENFRDAPNIVVADNASDDETLDIIAATTPHARIFRNKIGMGYPGGANLGLSQVQTEFALTVNPDSVVKPEAVTALLETADRYPEAAIVCPQNINLDGSPELTHDIPMFDRENVPSPYNKRLHEPVPDGDLCAEFVSGAVNLIRMSVIHELGGFDENIYLYYDDDDLCLRMREAGYVLILTPHAQIMHINAGSVRPSLHYKWEKFWNAGWARLYIEKKYHGTGSLLRLAVLHTVKFLIKSIAYTLTLRFGKALRDFAQFCGTVSFLVGIKAVKPRWKEVNERSRQ